MTDTIDLKLSHHPLASQHPRRGVSLYDLAQVAFFFFGIPKNGFGSIDVTSRCNLRCRHCYHFQHEHPEELTTDQWIAKLEEIKRSSPIWKFPFFNCSWVGGEPLLRKDLVQRGRRFFRYNTVVTNGTIPLPRWPDVNWYVSIDGDEETHDQLRGIQGCYRKARGHVLDAIDQGITIAYCINRKNVSCIEAVVKEWNGLGAKHITFDFYTPMEGDEAKELWIPLSERDTIIDRLIALRRIYGHFFVIPERVLRLMRSEFCAPVTRLCLLRRRSFAFNAGGHLKAKCVMGQKADCDRCGCVVPYYLWALTNRRMVLGDLGRSALSIAKAHWRGIRKPSNSRI